MKKGTLSSFIIPNLLVIPIILRWLLPVSIEDRLNANIFGVYFFLPDLLYLIYILTYKGKPTLYKNRKIAFMFLGLTFAFVLFQMLFSEGDSNYKFNLIINSFSFIYIPFIYINWPLNRDGLEKIKITLLVSLLILCGEVLLYSLGILAYTTADGDDLTAGLYDTGGIMRISTTVGAATGTAIIILMLGCIITGYYQMGKVKLYSLFILITVTLLFTVSRGSLLIWLLYIGIYAFKKLSDLSFLKKIGFMIVLAVSLVVLNNQGVFEPLKYRMETNRTDVTTGRDDLNNEAIRLIEGTGYFGVGIGNVFPEKNIQYKFNVPHYIGMHNTYLTYVAEIGLIGLFFLLMFYLSVIGQLRFHKIPLSLVVICVLLISFNTEAVFVDQEYIALFFLLITAALNFQPEVNAHNFRYHTNLQTRDLSI